MKFWKAAEGYARSIKWVFSVLLLEALGQTCWQHMALKLVLAWSHKALRNSAYTVFQRDLDNLLELEN